jgi:hypothetical protein
MTLAEFAVLVRDCRAMQDRYFAQRKQGRFDVDLLAASKRLEKAVDRAVADVLDPQPNLFPE